MTRSRALIAALLLAISAPLASEADPLNLEQGLPLEMEDGYATPLWNREYQGFLRYNRSARDQDVLEAVQRLEFGVWYNTELTVEAPFIFGEGKSDGYGPTPIELLYNLNQETTTLPALSVSGTMITPTGEYSEGLDSKAELYLTKTVPGTWNLHRIIVNSGYYFNDDPGDAERSGMYNVIAGYEARLNNPLVLVADVFRKEEMQKHLATNMVEVGLRYRLTPYSLLTSGVGTGFGNNSPEFRGTVGFQLQFFGF